MIDALVYGLTEEEIGVVEATDGSRDEGVGAIRSAQ
jgi:hypothetical protein